MPSITINDTTLTFDTLDPPLTYTLTSALSTNTLTPSHIYSLLTTLDTKSNYLYIEQLLQKTKEINQFTTNKDTYYLLALYIEITIAKLHNYTAEINQLFKTGDYKNLLGYYFIYQKKDTHNLLRNDPISMLGKRVLNPDNDMVRWRNGDQTLYSKIKHKYPRAAVFDNKFECMESVLMNVDVENVSDDYIEKVKQKIGLYGSEGYRSDLNALVGQIYHRRKDYLNAAKYYRLSKNENAVYNLMRITREIVDDNEKYSKITNYIKLINGRTDFVEPLSAVYSVKMSERWCGHALLAYFRAEDISNEIRIINLSYFYYKCLEDNEIEIIKQFYKLIKENNEKTNNTENKIVNFNQCNDETELQNTKYNIENESYMDNLDQDKNDNMIEENKNYQSIENKALSYEVIIDYCTSYIVKLLHALDTDLAKYNLSFFVPQPEAISLLNTVHTKDENVLARLSLLTNCLETIKEVVLLNQPMSRILLSNFYLNNNNTSQAKDVLKTMEGEYADATLAYIYYLQYKKNKNPEFLNLMGKHLKNYDNIYVVYLVAVKLFEKRMIDKCVELIKIVLSELERERNKARRKLLKQCYLVIGCCFMYKSEYEKGMDFLKSCGDKDLYTKMSALLEQKNKI